MIPVKYIYPKTAEEKLKMADSMHRTVYIYGACGFGKTTLIRQYLKDRVYLYVDCLDRDWQEQLRAGLETSPPDFETVVFDNLHLLWDEDSYRRITGLIRESSLWIILFIV